MRTLRTAVVLLLAAVHPGAAMTTSATTLERMSVAKMTQAAQLVERAQCLGNFVAWDGGEIWTFTSFEMRDSWKGAPSGATPQVTVRLPGGSVGQLTSTVSGVPRFHTSEEVILFLQPTARGDFSIVSWVQGTFRIHHEARSGVETVMQDTAAFDTYDPATRQFASEGIRDLSVAALRLRVQSALAAQSGEKNEASPGRNRDRAAFLLRHFPCRRAALRRAFHHAGSRRLPPKRIAGIYRLLRR
jgi:hypothetical protein